MTSTQQHHGRFDLFLTKGIWSSVSKSTRWGQLVHRAKRVHVREGWDIAGLSQRSSAYFVSNIAGLHNFPDIEFIHGVPAERKRFLILLDDKPVQSLAEVLPRLDVRDEHRLHLVSDREPREALELLGRLVVTLDRIQDNQSIIDAYWWNDTLVVLSPVFQRLHVPLSVIPRICKAKESDRRRFAIDEQGDSIYWPSHDVHMGWSQFLQAVHPETKLRADQQSADFNKRYGAAIRRLRKASDLAQSDIDGLDDRTVRRIEKGDTRATTSAITAFARAHKLSSNEYMQELADLMTEKA